MNTCEARKGFLTLSACSNPASSSCADCGRGMCTTHLAPQTGFSKCLDCAAKDPQVQEGEYDDVWSHRYRNDYYRTTGFVPLAGGAYLASTYYDSHDASSFSERDRFAGEDDVDRPGFGES